MSETKLTFKRYENKYLLSGEKYSRLMVRLEGYIVPDEYFKSTVSSVYYDTEDFSFIRTSLDAPIYKQKLRLRSYKTPGDEDEVFVELKEKFKGLVYKRRIEMSAKNAKLYLAGDIPAPADSQVSREIDWLLKNNRMKPKAFIAADRECYVAESDGELRITFDRGLRWRDYALDLQAGDFGREILPSGSVLMEIKIPSAVPLWLARILSELEIYPTSFSKYGTCYKQNLIRSYQWSVG